MLDSSASENRLEAVVLNGRRRLLVQTAMRDALLASAIAMGGVAALLALGTGYFPPVLLGLFVAAGITAGVLRWRRSQPRPYDVAQLLDRRWQTDDQVSTAYYFLKESDKGGPIAEQQRARAATLAASGDVVAALPLRLPHAGWGALAMLALIALLFVVRYSLQPALSLEQPLAAMLKEALLGPDEQPNAGLLQPEPARPQTGDEEAAPSLSEEAETRDAETRTEPPAPPDAAQTPADQDAEPLNVEIPEVEGLSVDESYGDEMDYNSLVDGEQQGQQQGEKHDSPSDAGTPSDQASAPNQENEAWNQENDSLLDRLKDAFENMLSKLNMEPQGGSQQPSESESPSDGESTGEKAEAAEGQAQGGASDAGEAQMEGGEPGEASSQQVSQGEGGNNSDQPGEGQPSSAAGGNDGSKDAAEQAAIEEAMGKLEELYSRRAEEMKGEVMIETETAQQSARTPYQPQDSGHQDLGGTVSRDAIPLAYQAYIKSYFENLRTKN
ncbi:MAG: hypothetical protein WD733_02380 [Bryobacterales bacterium]